MMMTIPVDLTRRMVVYYRSTFGFAPEIVVVEEPNRVVASVRASCLPIQTGRTLYERDLRLYVVIRPRPDQPLSCG